VQHDAGDHLARRRPRVAAQLDVAKAVECKVRFENLLAAAFERVIVGLPGAAQVRRVECAIGLSISAMAQRDRRARGPLILSRTRPTMFWPRSKIHFDTGHCLISRGSAIGWILEYVSPSGRAWR